MPVEPWLEPFVPKSGRVFLDVGANDGDYTRAFADRFREVVAFEPNPHLSEKLCDLPNNSLYMPIGVSDKRDKLTFRVYECSVHSRMLDENEAPTYNTGPIKEERTVIVDTLDFIVGPSAVDFIKIDVEGYEVRVVRGALNTIRACKPKLLIEIHLQDNEQEIRELLPDYRFQVVHHPEHEIEGEYYWKHYWLVGTS
jgi:FkbM family methyltransferase